MDAVDEIAVHLGVHYSAISRSLHQDENSRPRVLDA